MRAAACRARPRRAAITLPEMWLFQKLVFARRRHHGLPVAPEIFGISPWQLGQKAIATSREKEGGNSGSDHAAVPNVVFGSNALFRFARATSVARSIATVKADMPHSANHQSAAHSAWQSAWERRWCVAGKTGHRKIAGLKLTFQPHHSMKAGQFHNRTGGAYDVRRGDFCFSKCVSLTRFSGRHRMQITPRDFHTSFRQQVERSGRQDGSNSVLDCLNAQPLKTLKVVLHGFELLQGAPPPIPSRAATL
jgi:hypothetical protein